VKYAVAGGVVQVMLSVVAGAVELRIVDRGPGIAAEDRERLRKPFERGKEADPASGSGLGLALVEQIAAVHHAQFILTAPQDGSGLEAVIRFPIHKAKS
jgi:signal transduction histidine kinase